MGVAGGYFVVRSLLFLVLVVIFVKPFPHICGSVASIAIDGRFGCMLVSLSLPPKRCKGQKRLDYTTSYVKLNFQTAGILRQSLCNVAVKQSHNSTVTDQMRNQLLLSIIEGLTGSLGNLQKDQMDPNHAKVIISTILPQLTTFIGQYGNHHSNVKKQLCEGLKVRTLKFFFLISFKRARPGNFKFFI